MEGTADLAFVILSAGKGRRMRSSRPKVLHEVCGRSIVLHTLALAEQLGAKRSVLIVGTGEAEVRQEIENHAVEIVRQTELLGTGHAALHPTQDPIRCNPAVTWRSL